MQSIQQRLWPDPQPLVERLGREFFRKVPETPGVYLMRGRADTVLYVGKAKNLRHRLCSYRVANPERLPRRILRLIHLVESIVWEQCGDELAALRRESELLLALKPRFNRAGVWQGPKRFLLWRLQSSGLQLVVSETPVEGWSGVGPSGSQMIQLHRSLVRLLWRQLQPDRGLSGMPPGWFNGQHGPCVLIPQSDPGLASEVFAFLELLAQGDSESFGQWVLAAKNRFEQGVRDEDLTVVTEHFGAPLLTAFPCPRTT